MANDIIMVALCKKERATITAFTGRLQSYAEPCINYYRDVRLSVRLSVRPYVTRWQ